MNDKPSILVVDDQETLLFTYSLILQQQGYAVTATSTCCGAIQHLQQAEFDVVICDLGLDQGHSGLEVLDFAQQSAPCAKLVLLTGLLAYDVEQQSRRRGISVLHKPVGVPQLLQTVRTLADGGSPGPGPKPALCISPPTPRLNRQITP